MLHAAHCTAASLYWLRDYMRFDSHRRPAAHLLVFVLLSAVPSVAAKLAEADPARYLEHVKFLAAPEREGRDAGSKGLEDAANYIAERFKEYGLQPLGKAGSFLQPFTVTTGAAMGNSNRLIVHRGEESVSLRPGKDYVPVNFSSSGAVSGQVVFAGYGAEAEEFDYDDYHHLNVKGKILVVLRYEPKRFSETNGKSRPHTHHAHLITKAIEARNRGAKAVLLVNGRLEEDKEDLLLKFGGVSGPDDAGILMAQVRNELVNEWLAERNETLAGIQDAIDKEQNPRSFAFDDSLRISIEIDIKREKADVHNVAAYVPGKSNEYVVIGAHYDHLGLGGQNSLAPRKIGQVHHGADDNASGTAGLLELARLFAGRAGSLERGVLFLAFAGEEIGLLGSSHWVNNPTLKLDDAVAMLNMDMIGRVQKRRVYLGGVGTGSGLEDIVSDVSESYDFQIDRSKSGYSASDHTSFVGKNVPVLFFFSGLHGDYHKPTDTWDKIDSASASELVNLIGDVASRLVEVEERPRFVKVKRASHGSHVGGTGGGYGPWFGSVPDFGPVETGVKFADIQPGSPADKAGVKAGDILIEFGGSPVKNLYDFTHALRAHKIGDVVEVRVLREGNEIAATVTLEQRR